MPVILRQHHVLFYCMCGVHEGMRVCGLARSLTGQQRQKLRLPTLLLLVSSTPEELTGSSVHSAKDICGIGWMEILRKENIEGIFRSVHFCVVRLPVSTIHRHWASLLRLGRESSHVSDSVILRHCACYKSTYYHIIIIIIVMQLSRPGCYN